MRVMHELEAKAAESGQISARETQTAADLAAQSEARHREASMAAQQSSSLKAQLEEVTKQVSSTLRLHCTTLHCTRPLVIMTR